jgi:hypothetical protein
MDKMYAIDINDDTETRLKSKEAGLNGSSLETLERSEEPKPFDYVDDDSLQNAKSGAPYTGRFHANTQKKNDKRNFIQRLFKVVPDTKAILPDQANDNNSWRQSKASSKDRSSIDMKSRKESDDDDEGLVVATRVDPTQDEPIYAAIEYDPDSKPPLYKNRRCRVYTAVSLLIFTIIVALAVVYSTKKGKEVVVHKPVVYVTEAPTPRPTTDREALGINNKIETYVLQDNATFSDMDRDDP